MKHDNPSSFNNYEKCKSLNNVVKSRDFGVTRDWGGIRERNVFSFFGGGGEEDPTHILLNCRETRK
jgi:hypothetical protein